MNDGDVIKILRENRNISQKQLAKKLFSNTAALSRIENNEKKLSYDEIKELLSALRANIWDFDELKNAESPFQYYVKEYHSAYSSDDTKHLEQAFRYFDSNKDKSFDNQFYWLKIKKYFHHTHSSLIPQLESVELKELAESILSSKSNTQFDYLILRDFSPELFELDEKILEKLFTKLLPVPDEQLFTKSDEFRKAVTYNLNNAVNYNLMINNYETAQMYLDFLKTHLVAFPDTDFHLFSLAFQKLIDYHKTNDPIHAFNIREYIKSLEILELPDLANALTEDLNTFISNEKKDIKDQHTYIVN